MTTCLFCQKTFYNKSTLNRHLNVCKKKDTILFEEQINEIKKHYETQLETQKLYYETQIQNQREKIEKLENQIFEIAKQPKPTIIHTTKTTHNHQKTLNLIQHLATYDLNPEDIRQKIKTCFTEEVFHGGPRKIIEMTAQTLLMDSETQKPKMICTDSSRKNFKYIDPKSGELDCDPGFQKTHHMICQPLAEANWEIFDQKLNQADWFRDTWDNNNSFIGDRNRFADRLLPKLGSTLNLFPG